MTMTMNTVIYQIILDNYQGESSLELYRTYEHAKKRFEELFQEGTRKEEFDYDNEESNSFSFFDPHYNEYSTYIIFKETTLDKLFYD